jgi:predicted RND superfamily exporter protein
MKIWSSKEDQMPHLSKEVWLFLCLSLISVFVLFNDVDLTPRVDSNFFFSNSDPQSQDDNLISHEFKRRDNLLIINASGFIESPEYRDSISHLSDALLGLEGVIDLESISHGPKNWHNAVVGPLWQRLLIPTSHRSTNIIVFLKDNSSDTVIPKIEKLVAQFAKLGFHLTMAGSPYVVWHIGQLLIKDLKFFSLLVLMIFGIVIFWIFRLKEILFGSIISCISASMWTLMITHILGIKIGLLTANMATIVFVLTLSHIVFLTYNWKNVCSLGKGPKPVDEAIRITFSPSFWCMLTALLGFFSLLCVPAQPLKELGVSGIVGSLVALSVAYGIYPAFLRIVRPSSFKMNGIERYQEKVENFFQHKKKWISVSVAVLFLAALPGLWKVNTDPSLFSYFSKNSEIEKGLAYIDHRGGSSPLILVVKTVSGEQLNTNKSYRELWNLQRDLEDYPSVGSVISLPVLIAQAPRTDFMALFLSSGARLDQMEQPKYDEITKSFITEDRREGLFLLRMKESGRKASRLRIIDEIKKIVYADGFIPVRVGGVYSLQGHLAQLVRSSVLFGIGQLIIIFSLIAWIVSRSLRVTVAITASICVIPVIVLGMVGWLGIPLDVISAPACNIAIGLGIDSMIHMVRYYRRQRFKNKNNEMIWQDVRHHFGQPVFTFTLVMVLGFGIFMFSDFPSTQRFGVEVVWGALIAATTALFVMPAIALISFKTMKIELFPPRSMC